jgi:hypothetical protein
MKEVVLIASSSRGGSSVFTAFLRRSQSLLHLQGEVNPLLRLSGLGYPDSGVDSDALFAHHALGPAGPQVRKKLAAEAGTLASLPLSAPDWRHFTAALHHRLCIQWPKLPITAAEVAASADAARPHLDTLQVFHAELLCGLRQHHPQLNPHYYDLSRALIAERCPAPRPDGPPHGVIIEEPPFVTVAPWRHAAPDDPRPLVIKTPSNAYRLPFFRALLPKARLRVLHLTRNAAAAINGLYDGWRYPDGFYAHQLPAPLSISGYSERRPWGQRWWQYDLPPGWRQWTQAPLESVCGFQWRAAHQHTLDFLAAHPEVDRLQVRFEDLIGEPEAARRAIDRVVSWLGIEADPPLQQSTLLAMPPVMSTDTPRHRRWFEKAALLEPVLERADTKQLMEQLGYDPDPDTWL